MTFKPCNEVANKAFEVCMTAPADKGVIVPWLEGKQLNALGRLSLISAVTSGALGIANNSRGEYRIYYGAQHAGNWFFEVLALWKAALLAAPMIVGMCYGYLYGTQGAGEAWLGFISGLLAILAFGGRAYYQGAHESLGQVHQGFAGPTGVLAVLMTAAGIGAAIAGFKGIQIDHGSAPTFFSMFHSRKWGDSSIEAIAGILSANATVAFGMIAAASTFIWAIFASYQGNKFAVERVFENGHATPVTQALYHTGVAQIINQSPQLGRGLAMFIYWAATLVLATWPLWK